MIPEGSPHVAGGGAGLATPPGTGGDSEPRRGSSMPFAPRCSKSAGAPAGARLFFLNVRSFRKMRSTTGYMRRSLRDQNTQTKYSEFRPRLLNGHSFTASPGFRLFVVRLIAPVPPPRAMLPIPLSHPVPDARATRGVRAPPALQSRRALARLSPRRKCTSGPGPAGLHRRRG